MKISKSDILLFSCIRNEQYRLESFLEHYRTIGVNYFFFIDNGSEDDTVNFLLSQNDTYIFQTEESYAESNFGMNWIHELLSKFSVGNWTLIVDADELFIYPYFEKVGIHLLAEYLDAANADSVKSFLLDMYANKPIINTQYISGESFIKTCPYFDKDTYSFEKGILLKKKNAVPVRGGVRHRLFWNGFNRKKPSPVLKKFPFIKWSDDHHFKASTHDINHNTEASITGILLHFKLISRFYDYSKKESNRNEHWDNAAQYKSYWDVLKKNRSLNPYFEGSIRYKNSQQLIDLNLMHVSKKFNQFIEKHVNHS